ncbi:helix-turn-helix transcriptional regulator [Malikia sp.]|uniref:ArsR/SmtB family transcription factor n=1 Tax=Malikia sp. TaxID=2070706 RepID=UPI0026384359|nr:metalloregulator ArsR/SmtB family transcription factor [Malikia sp.]MDD2729935.1 metalloregulator ArsR/SmtB family transcription factor [Malikia sp.]
MNDAEVVKALGALAQESRLRLFRLLVVAGREGATPTRMGKALGIAPTLISFHMKELVNAGLVSQARDGRHIIYRAQIDAMNDLLGFLTANCCGGEPCLNTSLPLQCSTY